jgi:ribosomal protein S18 acetylase RimI-like enzyme
MADPEAASQSPPAAVREATAADARVLYALTLELADALGDWRPRSEAVEARLLELLEEPRVRVLVAEIGDDAVGAASLWIKPDLAHGDKVIEVPMLVVSESARCRGVGKLLIEEIKNIAAAENAALIELVAARKNQVARAFYRALGFVETDHIALELIGDMQGLADTKE